ncbi:MAG: DUF2949 domain-containing protein [Phormidesmis sp.]
MRHDIHRQFLQYLQEEFSISKLLLEKVIRFIEKDLYLLPIALWQYELLTVNQLDQVYDWLAVALKEAPEKKVG